ncbi:MAG: hypothetical protein IBX36_05130 [Dehalococcoidia bacterium]|nr:hypothetical protein [Dehalococcoidia bacterium]
MKFKTDGNRRCVAFEKRLDLGMALDSGKLEQLNDPVLRRFPKWER